MEAISAAASIIAIIQLADRIVALCKYYGKYLLIALFLEVAVRNRELYS
jgi:hypothetical protein